MTRTNLALQVTQNSYGFMVLENKKWIPVDTPRFLQTYKPGGDISFRLYQDNQLVSFSDKSKARILLTYSGEMTPFELKLEDTEGVYTHYLGGSLMGELLIQSNDFPGI